MGILVSRSTRSLPCLTRMFAGVMALTLSLMVAPSVAGADDIDDRRAEAERRQSQLLDQQAELEEQLEDTDAQLAQAVLDLHRVEAKLPLAEAELDAANAEVERTQREAELLAQRLTDAEAQEVTIEADIELAQADAKRAEADLAEQARRAYRGDSEISAVTVMTGAQNTEEFVKDFALSTTIARSQARVLADSQSAASVSRNRQARLDAVRSVIRDLKAQADQNHLAAQDAQEDAANRKAEVARLIAAQQQHHQEIEARKDNAYQLLQEADAAFEQVKSELKGIVAQQRARDEAAERDRRAAEEAQRQTGGGSGTSSPPTANSGSGGGKPPSTRGPLAYPTANPYVTSHYGMRLHPVYNVMRLHAGTDFRAACGVPVLSSADGTVVIARTLGNGANYVVVDHGYVDGVSLMTGYVHLSRWAVRVGQRVSQGELVGWSGNTGVGTGCHLHFEVYVNGDTVNPMTWLK